MSRQLRHWNRRRLCFIGELAVNQASRKYSEAAKTFLRSGAGALLKARSSVDCVRSLHLDLRCLNCLLLIDQFDWQHERRFSICA
jgi:hypothetical protein